MTELHSARMTICMKTGGKVEIELTQATAIEMLDWLEPALAYLRDRAASTADPSPATNGGRG